MPALPIREQLRLFHQEHLPWLTEISSLRAFRNLLEQGIEDQTDSIICAMIGWWVNHNGRLTLTSEAGTGLLAIPS